MKCFDKNKTELAEGDTVVYRSSEYDVDELDYHNMVKLVPLDSVHWTMWINASQVEKKTDADDKFAEWCRIYEKGSAA